MKGEIKKRKVLWGRKEEKEKKKSEKTTKSLIDDGESLSARGAADKGGKRG